MLVEIIIALLLGLIAGTFTGVFPGIHINLVAAILVASLASIAFLQSIPPIVLIVFIVSMSITHTFIDFIPSIYLGAPEEDSFLAILPGHQLLKEGKAHEATVLTLKGSLTALPIILVFIPIFVYILPVIFSATRSALPFLLIFVSLYLVFREKEVLQALIVFLLAGFLGFIALNLPVKEPLLPLLTGLFGLSSIIVSLKNKTKIPKQKITPLKEIKIPKKQAIKTALAAAAAAPLCSFLPGIGSGHAAVIGSEIVEQDKRGFLFLVGAINTIVVALSFITLYSIGRTRTGVASAVKEILNTITKTDLALILLTIFISGIVAFIIGVNISKIFTKIMNKIDYKILSTAIITVLIFITLIFSNPLGLIVLITATALGVFTILSGARRINLMGSLLIPTIIFYLTL